MTTTYEFTSENKNGSNSNLKAAKEEYLMHSNSIASALTAQDKEETLDKN